MSDSYRENLINVVLNNSNSSNWTDAVREWKIEDCEEDDLCQSTCICGKENIKYLFTIRNKYNNAILFPIGSTCINKFNREDLDNEVDLIKQKYALVDAIKSKQYIELTPEFFSRKLINRLYDEGAFNTEFNDYDGHKDYDFFLKMFNKRNKNDISFSQERKIKAIIMNIISYLKSELKWKTH